MNVSKVSGGPGSFGVRALLLLETAVSRATIAARSPQGPVRTEVQTELNERGPPTPRLPTKTYRCGRPPAYRSARVRRLRHHSQPATPATTTAHTAWLSRATRLISAGASGRGLSPMKGLGTSWPW